jgi:hypothetical protein
MEQQEPASRASRIRTALFLVAFAAAIVLTGALIVRSLDRSGGGQAPHAMDAAEATSRALDFYRAAHQGVTVSDVKVLSVTLGPDESGLAVWKVEVGGAVTEPGQTFAYGSYMVLYVDPSSGRVRVFAQG